MKFVESDPSDHSPDEAYAIATSEAGVAELTEREQSAARFVRLGYEPPVTLAELRGADLSLDFLVDRCLVRGQPCTISGASKGMKTTLSIHLALSLASGEPFLGRFEVAEPCKVLFASAESGAATIRRNVYGMAEAMGLDIDIIEERLAFQWWVPKSSNADLVEYFSDGVEGHGANVVIMDPLYLMLGGENQSNLSSQGDEIMTLMRRLIDLGCTPIVDDHVKRSSENAKTFKPIQLEDITGAGKAECFRQWMLLGRRSRFETDGDALTHDHDLWATIGGSAGFNRTWGLDIVEEFNGDYSEVAYAVSLREAADVKDEQKAVGADAASERAARKEEAAHRTLLMKCDKVASELNRKPGQLFARADIRAIAKVSGDKANEIIFELESSCRIAKHPEGVKRGNNICEAWQALGTANMDLQDAPPNAGQKWES